MLRKNCNVFFLGQVVTRQYKKLFPIGNAPEPIISSIDNDTLAVGKDAQSILINSKGESTHKYKISWSELPSAVRKFFFVVFVSRLNLFLKLFSVFDKPFLMGYLPDAIEIRTVEPNMFLQKLPCSKGTMMTRARAGVVFIANGSLVWCLQAVAVHHQIKSLLQDQQFELALRIAVSLSSFMPAFISY